MNKEERTEYRLNLWMTTKRTLVIESFVPRIQKVLKEYNFTPITEVSNAYLYGPARTGKTINAAWRVLEWHKSQFIQYLSTDYLFISVPELLSCARELINKGGSEVNMIEKYKTCRLLVLDDFGSEKLTEWAYTILYAIISYRYDYMKPTIYTSNFSLDELATKLQDDRIPSRIAQDCVNSVIEFKNKPYF